MVGAVGYEGLRFGVFGLLQAREATILGGPLRGLFWPACPLSPRPTPFVQERDPLAHSNVLAASAYGTVASLLAGETGEREKRRAEPRSGGRGVAPVWVIRQATRCHERTKRARGAGNIAYPNDTIRRRLQFGARETYLGAAQSLFREGGPARFYKGCLLYNVKVAPAAAMQFATYYGAKQLLQRYT